MAAGCRAALEEMGAAMGAAVDTSPTACSPMLKKLALQSAIRRGVAWLAQNGSNPDVAASSNQVSHGIHDTYRKQFNSLLVESFGAVCPLEAVF